MDTYMRDGRGSTLVIGEESLIEPSYQMEMLRKNRPVGLLPVQICAINKQKEYHYDAGSFMALSEYLEKRVINCEMLGYFMESIKGVLSSIEEYLLEADCLCMLPEHIYLDEKEYMLQFCYGPYKQEVFEKGLLKLLQYFLQKLDYSDKQGVTMAYQMYQNVMKEGYASVFTYKIIEQQPKEQEIVFPWEEEKKEEPNLWEEELGTAQKKQIIAQWGIYAVGIILCGAVAGFCYWQNNLLLCGGALLAAAIGLYFLIHYGRQYKGH
ncbi:MAG: hypothetical protein HFG39_12795 [Lachnospiraceae bacterium]|nr:hypothetical protein [Lachnospiraceae bacterium]